MRYIIGVDLGTSNSCVFYIDTQEPRLSIQHFRVSQIHSLGHVEALPALPSFCYLQAAKGLPWQKSCPYTVGAYARDEGMKTPTRLVESAKSWLCHSAVNQHDRLLPLDACDPAERISPVEASARYLTHIKDAWNYSKAKNDPDAQFEEQDIFLTVPASFDEIARSLTLEAARVAGLRQLTLLEEPQAAFYSWLAQHEKEWKSVLRSGQTILVCDIGGGTTDFSLIEVFDKEGELSLRRMAVGDHLLLGGDNMDIAVAQSLERQSFEKQAHGNLQEELSVAHWHQLRHQSRKAKEVLLDDTSDEKAYHVILQGAGAKVVGQTLQGTLERSQVESLLANGFFPVVDWEEALQLRRSLGVKTMGLPYETEPAITKHLASFLQSGSDTPKAPAYVLFNGGAMKPKIFQEAILSSIERWFPGQRPEVLTSYHLDLAVGRGAAYYGKVRRGLGVRIGGGSARGYYLEVAIQGPVQGSREEVYTKKAVSLLPRGSEEGFVYESERMFLLKPNTPVSFTLLSSHVRLYDEPGSVVEIEPSEMQPLPPIQTVLRFGKDLSNTQSLPARLGIALTAVGTLNLWVQSVNTPHRWTLEFQLRTVEGKEKIGAPARQDETFDASFLDKPKEVITAAFEENGKADKLMESLENMLEKGRKDWSISLLRGLSDPLFNISWQRNKNSASEVRWWNLAGFLLRPGFGYPLDDFRIKEMWKILLPEIRSAQASDADIQKWICIRRLAGGFNRGQQTQVAAWLWPQLMLKPGKISLKGKGDLYPYTEKLRTASSLELIDTKLKIQLGSAILARIEKEKALPVELWALGRLGARHLFHGSAGHVIPPEIALKWLQQLLDLKEKGDMWDFAVSQMARKTDRRELNVPQKIMQEIVAKLEHTESYERIISLLTNPVPLLETEKEKVFGEQLPAGLILPL